MPRWASMRRSLSLSAPSIPDQDLCAATPDRGVPLPSQSEIAASRPKRNTRRVNSRSLVALAAVAALLGCGESEEDEAPPDDPRRVAIA